MDKKSFVLIVNEFWGCVGLSFEEYCWLDWFCVMFVKGKCWVFKGNAVKVGVRILNGAVSSHKLIKGYWARDTSTGPSVPNES